MENILSSIEIGLSGAGILFSGWLVYYTFRKDYKEEQDIGLTRMDNLGIIDEMLSERDNYLLDK